MIAALDGQQLVLAAILVTHHDPSADKRVCGGRLTMSLKLKFALAVEPTNPDFARHGNSRGARIEASHP